MESLARMVMVVLLMALGGGPYQQSYHVHGYPDGAGREACPDQSPQKWHKVAPQLSPAPFNLTADADTYSPGVTVNVTLEVTNTSMTFEGFLLGAHRVRNGVVDLSQYLGAFGNASLYQPQCGQGWETGATHVSSMGKQSVTFEWTSTTADEGDIVFSSAVLQGFSTFWVNVTSAALTPGAFPSNESTTPSGPQTTAAPSSFKKDSECGKSKSCYGDCTEDVCTILATWSVGSNQSLAITIKSVVTSGGDAWASVGFGTEASMNPGSVTDCIANGDEVQTFTSYNNGYSNVLVTPDNKTGLSRESGSLEDGVLTCSVQREMEVAGGPQVFNLTDADYHVMLARGKAESGFFKDAHAPQDAWVTPNSYNVSTVIDLTPKPKPATKFQKDSECGKSKACYGDCMADGCTILATWSADSNQSLAITIKSLVLNGGDNAWAAIGFGTDPSMNPASVTECVANGGEMQAFSSYNDAYTNVLVAPDNKTGLSRESGSLEDGVLTCSVQRQMEVAGGPQVFNLTDTKYHVMLTRGKASGWIKHPHFPHVAWVTHDSYNISAIVDLPPKPTPSANFPKDSECGKSKSCYGDCTKDGCTILATWSADSNQSLAITVKSLVASGGDNVWAAIGFGTGASMNPASVTDCIANGGEVQTFTSYNNGYSNVLVTPDNKTGLSRESGSLEDGVLTCSVQRQMEVAGGPQVFNLTDADYHVMLARGVASGWVKQEHASKDAQVTADSYNVSAIVDVQPKPPPTPSPSASASFPKDSACGKTKSCYGDCANGNCTIMVTWFKEDTWMTITTKSIVTSGDNAWVAVGFGLKAKMNPASVTDCVVNGGQVQSFVSYNKDYGNSMVKPNNKTSLSHMSGSLEDGVLTCTVQRQMVMNGGPQVYNLTNTKYHIMLARGKASGWTKLPHDSASDYVTAASYDLTAIVDVGAAPPSLTLVKLHGCIMTVAWVLAASVGVLIARFYKASWSDQTFMGLKVWFGIHRLLMVIVFLATAVGFIIIFVHVGGYSEIMGTSFQKAHPVLGIIVTALTVLNPIMSLFRCGPDHDMRPLFNWAHFVVGSSAYILGVFTVVIGTNLSTLATAGYVSYVVAAFGAWHVLAHFMLEMTAYSERNASNLGIYQDLQSSSLKTTKRRYIRHGIFALHVSIAWAVCVAVFVGILN